MPLSLGALRAPKYGTIAPPFSSEGHVMRLVLPVSLALLVTAAVVPMQAGQSAAPVRTPPTFSKEIAPILQKNCQVCHRPGSIAPMSLLTYQEARPWARSIKEQVILRQMRSEE